MGVHKRNGIVYLDVHKLPEKAQSELDRRRYKSTISPFFGYIFLNFLFPTSLLGPSVFGSVGVVVWQIRSGSVEREIWLGSERNASLHVYLLIIFSSQVWFYILSIVVLHFH